MIAVTGRNGSGKSTLLRIVAGLLRPTRGTVIVSSNGETAENGTARRRMVGYCSPDLALYPELTARENLLFFGVVRGGGGSGPVMAGECDALLEAVGLRGRGNDPVGAYSSGMRQRLRLAFARWGNPPVLLLDEPSLALDQSGVGIVAEMIAAQKAAGGLTLLATNDADEAALGDRTVVLGD